MKNEKKKVWKSITVIAVVLSVLAVAMVGTASAKSLYVIAEHHTGQFDAYNINAAGDVTYQYTVNLQQGNPTDCACYEVPGNEMLFITSEFSGKVEIVDPILKVSLGMVVAPGASNLCGIEVDDNTKIVYTADRNTCILYAYDWNPVAQTLTLRHGYPVTLQGCTGAWGLALDETTNRLYVADGPSGQVIAYDTTVLPAQHAPVYTVLVAGPNPCDVAVDRQRQLLYTTCPDGTCENFPYNGNTIMQIDIATGNQIPGLQLSYGTMGVAVEEIRGYIYFTAGCAGDTLEVWDPSTTPNWTPIDNEGDIGNPAGLCIGPGPGDLNPIKTDITTGTCVNPGGSVTYKICYDNTKNPNMQVTNVVLVDDFPPDMTFVSATGGGTQTGTNQVTWNIGTLPGGAPQQCVQLTVDVKTTAAYCEHYNYATIVSDQTPPETVSEMTKVCGPCVPEFSTIVIPVASILGLLFFFNYRKRKREQ